MISYFQKLNKHAEKPYWEQRESTDLLKTNLKELLAHKATMKSNTEQIGVLKSRKKRKISSTPRYNLIFSTANASLDKKVSTSRNVLRGRGKEGGEFNTHEGRAALCSSARPSEVRRCVQVAQLVTGQVGRLLGGRLDVKEK